MSEDLVKRLCEVGGISDDGATRWYINPDGPEAADRIEKLEAALRMTIAHVNEIDPMENKHRIEALNIARKALEGKDDE